MAITASLDPRATGGSAARLFLHPKPVRSGGHRIAVLLHNLSTTGVLIESSYDLSAGERIEVCFAEQTSEFGTITWTGSGLFGCQFGQAVAVSLVKGALASEFRDAEADRPRTPAGETFGAKLQRLRTTRGLSQADVAEKLGLSAVAISNWESDRSFPRHHRLEELANALGVPRQHLATNAVGLPVALPELIVSSKNRIAGLIGVAPDQVKITVDL